MTTSAFFCDRRRGRHHLRLVTSDPSRDPRVLVCEDSDDARELLVTILRAQGLHVDEAASGRQALGMVLEGSYDVAFIDLGLPDISGLDVAARVRGAEVPVRTRLVALTGYATPEDFDDSRRAGFDIHLRKPATVEQLLAAVRDPSALRRSRR